MISSSPLASLIPVLVWLGASAAFAQTLPGSDQAELSLDHYTIRHQIGGSRVLELTGDRAFLRNGNVIDLESIHGNIFLYNKPFLTLTARRASLRVDETHDSAVRMDEVRGRFYYGGTFQAGSLRISLKDGGWAADQTEFSRAPVEVHGQAFSGPLSLDRITGDSAAIFAEKSTASAKKIRFETRKRIVKLEGNATYRSETSTLRADSLTLQFDPTFTRLIIPGKSSAKKSAPR